VTLLTASSADVAALNRAVRPVYRSIDEDPVARRLVTAIRALERSRKSAATDSIACPHLHGSQSIAARLDGTWQASVSTADLIAAGAEREEDERQTGESTLSLRDGRWTGRESHSGFVWSGRYSVQGNVLRLIDDVCPQVFQCSTSAIAAFTWSLYEDRLALAPYSGTPSYFGLFAAPLTRTG
jgi:hypothetical protein